MGGSAPYVPAAPFIELAREHFRPQDDSIRIRDLVPKGRGVDGNHIEKLIQGTRTQQKMSFDYADRLVLIIASADLWQSTEPFRSIYDGLSFDRKTRSQGTTRVNASPPPDPAPFDTGCSECGRETSKTTCGIACSGLRANRVGRNRQRAKRGV